jgi:hypothetical protein
MDTETEGTKMITREGKTSSDEQAAFDYHMMIDMDMLILHITVAIAEEAR